jgi:hypothetical protein
MAATPNKFISPQSVKGAAVVTSAAETAYHAPVTAVVKLMTAGLNGSRVTRLRSRPRASASATALHLYLSTDAGVTKVLIDSALVLAHTPATSTKIPETDWLYSDVNPLILPANAELWISQAVLLANGIAHEIEWGDF